MIPMELDWDGEGHSLKLIEEQRNDWDERVALVNGIKKIYQLNLQIDNVHLEFGMQLLRFLEIIFIEKVNITSYGEGQTVDIKLSSYYKGDLIETATKIQEFAKDNGHKVIFK
ncbi:hypothetical protein [Escherichia phage vB_EcoM-E33]|nr:hypothetical protein [Escherichia phage vB_EcoM-E33]